MAAEAMGVSTQKLNDMLENGEVLAEDLLPKLAQVLENRFGAAAVESAESARASFNRLTNAMTELHRTVGENGLIDAMADLANNTRDLLVTHRELIASGLGSIFDAATRSAELFLDASSGVLKVLDAIKSVRNINLGEIYTGSGKQKKLLADIVDVYSDIAIVKEKLSSKTDAEDVKRLTKELEVLEARSWDLNAAYDETVELQKKKAEAAKHNQSEAIRGANKIMEAAKYRNKVELFLAKEKYDELDQKRNKEISAEKAKYAQYIAMAERAERASGVDSSGQKAKLVEAREKAIAEIEAKYAKKRETTQQKSINSSVRLYNKQTKAVDKALKEQFDDLDKYQVEYVKTQEEYDKEIKKISLSTFDYQVSLLEEEKQEWIDKGISVVDAEELTSKKLKKLYDERATAARAASLSAYGDSGTKNDDYWKLRSDDIDAYIEKLHEMGVSEEAIGAASAKKWQEYNDDKAKAENDFLGSVAAGLHEYQELQKTWGENLADITETAAKGMSSAFSDTLFDALKGDIDDISQIWTSFMDTMLHSLTDTVADMAVQWGVGAIGSATGWWDSGAWEVKQDHVAVVHAGEMIVPADVASIIRSGKPTTSELSPLAQISPSGGYEWSQSDKDRLTGLMNNPSTEERSAIGQLSDLESVSRQKASAAAVKSFAQSLAQGASLASQGAVSPKDVASGMLGPNLGSAAFAGLGAYTNSELGLDTSAFGVIGGMLGNFANALSGGNPALGMLGNLAGSFLGMGIGDMLDARENEDVRDYLEDKVGWATGLRAYASLKAAYDNNFATKQNFLETVKSFFSSRQPEDYMDPINYDLDYGYTGDVGGSDTAGSAGMGVGAGLGAGLGGLGGIGGAAAGAVGAAAGAASSAAGSSSGNASGSSDTGDSSFATGGYIDSLMVPYGEDGWAAVQFGEGVVSKAGMQTLENLNEGNLEDFYPEYEDESNLESIISSVNSIQKAVYEAIGKDVSTTLTLQDAGIVLEESNMAKVVELFDSISDGGIEASELESAFQAFVGVGLSTDDAVSATELLIDAYEEQEAAAEEAAAAAEAAAEALAKEIASFQESVNDIILRQGLTDYKYEMLQLSEWYDEQAALAEELGLSLDDLNLAYRLQVYELNRTEVEKTVSDATSELNDVLSELSSELDDAESVYNSLLSEQITVQEDLASSAEELIDTFQDLVDSLEETRSGILTGSSTPGQTLSYYQSLFNSTYQAALSGDTTAAGDLASIAEDVISAAESSIADPEELRNIVNSVTRSLYSTESYFEDSIEEQQDIVDNSQAQLDTLSEQLSVLESTNEITMTLAEAAEAYFNAQAAYSAADETISSATTDTSTSTFNESIYLANKTASFNAKLAAGDSSALATAEAFGISSSGATISDIVSAILKSGLTTYQHYAKYGSSEGISATKLQSFAGGGIATGPTSGYLANLHGTEAVIPVDGGYIPVALTPDSNVSDNTEVVLLLQTILNTLGISNKTQIDVRDILDRVTQGQNYIATQEVV